jgi:hypothetical protein
MMMKQRYNFLLIWASLSFTASAVMASGIAPESTDARAIMLAVQNRPAGDKKESRMQLTIQDSGGRTRERMLQLSELDFEESKKSMVFFESPADVRNVALLTVDYNAGHKSDDQWLFMPKLRRTTRIGSSKRSGAFMGSDFTYGDMTQLNPELYHYRILKQDILVSGEDCWLIEARPKTEAEQEQSGAIKQHLWVSKSKLIPIRMKSWVRKGKKLRYLTQEKIKLIDGFWTAFVTRARTVRNGKVESESSLEILQVEYGVNSVAAADFNLRNLEKGI